MQALATPQIRGGDRVWMACAAVSAAARRPSTRASMRRAPATWLRHPARACWVPVLRSRVRASSKASPALRSRWSRCEFTTHTHSLTHTHSHTHKLTRLLRRAQACWDARAHMAGGSGLIPCVAPLLACCAALVLLCCAVWRQQVAAAVDSSSDGGEAKVKQFMRLHSESATLDAQRRAVQTWYAMPSSRTCAALPPSLTVSSVTRAPTSGHRGLPEPCALQPAQHARLPQAGQLGHTARPVPLTLWHQCALC